MRRRAGAVVLIGLLLGLTACGDDDDAVESGGEATTTTTVDETTTTTGPEETTTTSVAAEASLSLFPADDVEDTPEGAAAGFMARYFPGAVVTFGEFAEGDGEAGEIDVLGGGEGGGAALLRSTLLLRRIDGGWHVIAAVNPNVAITAPEAQAEIPADEPLVVEGTGRGFEATIVVRVESPGHPYALERIAAGGSGETPEPFTSEQFVLDPNRVGETLAVIASGGTGLAEDPGEFSAIPVVLA